MSTLFTANTTCDIVNASGSVIQGVPITLVPDWPHGQQYGKRDNDLLTWTHYMYVPLSVPVRDRYTGASTNDTNNDVVYVPGVQAGTPFNVTFIEILLYGAGNSYKKVYLDRQTPIWPTDNL
jgi:hypothetical protein